MSEKPSFFSELKRRNVYNIADPDLPEEVDRSRVF
jgi:hypothetical protein